MAPYPSCSSGCLDFTRYSTLPNQCNPLQTLLLHFGEAIIADQSEKQVPDVEDRKVVPLKLVLPLDLLEHHVDQIDAALLDHAGPAPVEGVTPAIFFS